MNDHNHHEFSVEELETKTWKKRLIGSWIFATPIALLMIFERLLKISLVPESIVIPIFLILGFPIIFIFGFGTVKSGFRGLFTGYFNMDSLISLGTVIAYLTGFFSYFNFVADYSGVSSMIMVIFIKV